MIVNVYIDGMNLFYGCLKGTPHKWLDLVALSQALMPRDTIKTVRYFTAPLAPSLRNPGQHHRQQAYLRALETLPEVRIHLGYFRQDVVRMPVANPPPSTIAVVKSEEKGSDVNLATYLLRDAFRQECERQLVITNDSDLAEPIRLVRQELRMPLVIVSPYRRRNQRLVGDGYRQIRQSTLTTCQLPLTIKDGNGVVSKPTGW